MEDQGQMENPSDFSDPSVEQNERLLAIDEEITDDDDRVIAAKLESQASGRSPAIECLCSLVCVDKSSKHYLHRARGCKQANNLDISPLDLEIGMSHLIGRFFLYNATNCFAMQMFF